MKRTGITPLVALLVLGFSCAGCTDKPETIGEHIDAGIDKAEAKLKEATADEPDTVGEHLDTGLGKIRTGLKKVGKEIAEIPEEIEEAMSEDGK